MRSQLTYPAGSPEHVYFEGLQRIEKGKKPNAILLLNDGFEIRNPRIAFYFAEKLIFDTPDDSGEDIGSCRPGTLLGQPFIRQEEGSELCGCENCLHRITSTNPANGCNGATKIAKKHFGFTGIARKVQLPTSIGGKSVGQYCPKWLSPTAN